MLTKQRTPTFDKALPMLPLWSVFVKCRLLRLFGLLGKKHTQSREKTRGSSLQKTVASEAEIL